MKDPSKAQTIYCRESTNYTTVSWSVSRPQLSRQHSHNRRAAYSISSHQRILTTNRHTIREDGFFPRWSSDKMIIVKLIQQMRSPIGLLSGDYIRWPFPLRITAEVGLGEGSGFRLSQGISYTGNSMEEMDS